jgi:hypothetical protein
MATGYGDDIKAIVEGCSPDARLLLLSLLSNVFSTLDNLDVLCPVIRPPCHDYLKFVKLRRLHAALHVQAARDRTAKANLPNLASEPG